MLFDSRAQRRKFVALLVDGKVSNKTFEEWNRETCAAELAAHAAPKSATKKSNKGASVNAKRSRQVFALER